MVEANVYSCDVKEKKERASDSSQVRKVRLDFFVRCLGILMSMAMPVSGMSPFGISFLAQEKSFSLKAVVTFFMVSLGSMIACGRIEMVKYIMAGIIYLGVLFVLKKGVMVNSMTAGILAGMSILISGLVVLFVQGQSLWRWLLLICEVVMVVAGTFMMEKGGEFLRNHELRLEDTDADTKLSIGALTAVAILSLKELYLGADLSVMNCAASVLLLIISQGCGIGYSTGAGVVLGLVCGIGSDFFMPILGAFAFCGFVSGAFSRFGKGGVISGLVLANGIMVIYTNSAVEAVLSLFEVVVSSVVYGFVPWSIIEKVRSVIKAEENDNVMKIKDGIRQRLLSVGNAFNEMTKTLKKLSEYEEMVSVADVSAVLDSASDKVCRKCRKSMVCWGKDYNTVRGDMLRLLDILKERGKLSLEDIGERMKRSCINLSEMVNELNHRFDIYRVQRSWRNKLSESREIVGEQLGGVSVIMEELASEIKDESKAASVPEWKVRAALEMKDINASEVRVSVDRDGRNYVELLLKNEYCEGKLRQSLEKAMKTILKCRTLNMLEKRDGRRFTKIIFSEAERYAVEACHAECSASKNSGDNIRALHLSGGKYVIAVSDGMGTGSRAAKESEAILELLDSLLRAGFDSKTAIKLINSVMIMKSEENTFVTMDICIVDLYTGEVKFVKTGAEPSFILQKDGKVETVESSSLPAGIVSEAEASVVTGRVCEGDRIIMITDGIENRENGSLWLEKFLKESCRGKIAKEMPKFILEHALKENDGEVKDDMTVLTVELKAAG